MRTSRKYFGADLVSVSFNRHWCGTFHLRHGQICGNNNKNNNHNHVPKKREKKIGFYSFQYPKFGFSFAFWRGIPSSGCTLIKKLEIISCVTHFKRSSMYLQHSFAASDALCSSYKMNELKKTAAAAATSTYQKIIAHLSFLIFHIFSSFCGSSLFIHFSSFISLDVFFGRFLHSLCRAFLFPNLSVVDSQFGFLHQYLSIDNSCQLANSS